MYMYRCTQIRKEIDKRTAFVIKLNVRIAWIDFLMQHQHCYI